MSMPPDKSLERNGNFSQLLTSVYENHSLAIMAMDQNGVLTHWSPGAEQLLGYSAEEMLGQHYSAFASPQPVNQQNSLDQEIREKIQAGQIAGPYHVQRITKGAELLNVQQTWQPVMDPASGTVVGVVCVFVDITEQKKAETALVEQIDQVNAIVETVLDAIITIDGHGIILAVNPAVKDIFGYEADELIGQNVKILMPAPYHDEHDGYIENFKRTRQAKIIGSGREVTGIRKNGETFPMDLAVNSTVINGNEAFVGVVKDISLRKQQEAALTEQYQLTAKTNAELKETLDALRSAQKELIDAEKMASLGTMIAGVAHEINTPIGVSLTAVSHLSEENRATSIALSEHRLTQSGLNAFLSKGGEAIALIQRNLERATRLIGSFKQLSLDQANERVHNLNLQEFLTETLLAAKQELAERNCTTTLECPDNIYLTINQAGLLQIIRNLVLNAAMHGYGEQGGLISVRAFNQGSSVLIQVSDNGQGMSAEVAAKVFEPFFTTRRSTGSMGLGMHLVYNLVKQSLKGKISVESEKGKGTTFSITLPK